MSNMFTGLNQMGPSLIPNPQQVVIPQITIPQGFQINQSIPQNSIIVKGKDIARSYKLPPNFRGALFDEDAPVFYSRETDANGNDVCFRTCSYAEIEEPAPPEYLTVQEFKTTMEAFAKKLKVDMTDE